MKTLQDQYKLILEGKGNKTYFLKQALRIFPNYFNQYSNFNTVVKVLKGKQILNEDKEEIKDFDPLKDMPNLFNYKDKKNPANLNFNEILKGFYTEMNVSENKAKTVDEIIEIVNKNLAEDPLFYVKGGQFGLKGVGYTNEASGSLKIPKEVKGKYKSSGMEELKENKLSLKYLLKEAWEGAEFDTGKFDDGVQPKNYQSLIDETLPKKVKILDISKVRQAQEILKDLKIIQPKFGYSDIFKFTVDQILEDDLNTFLHFLDKQGIEYEVIDELNEGANAIDNYLDQMTSNILDTAETTDEDGIKILAKYILNDDLEGVDLEDGNEWNQVNERIVDTVTNEMSLKEVEKLYNLLKDNGLVPELEDLKEELDEINNKWENPDGELVTYNVGISLSGEDYDLDDKNVVVLEPNMTYILKIDYPLNHSIKYKVGSKKGMTLSQLIDEIQNLYERTYNEQPKNIWGHSLEQLVLEQINIEEQTITLSVGS